MSRVELNANVIGTAPAIKRRSVLSSVHALPVLATLAVVALAALLGWAAWQYYMGTPWTRDGTVRAYVVKVAPQVAGEIVSLPIADNQFVHKGDLLMLIDPRNYSIAIRQAQAAVEQAQAVADNARAEMIRREKLTDIAVTMEERQTYISQATTAEATYQSALANLEQARINYKRTQVRSPVNGYVTNLSAQLGNYADVGSLQLSLVNSDSYWVDAYFEETALSRIQEGDAATIKLMGYTPLLRGRVQGLARGIDVPNAAPDASGLASVNPIFTFVRLAQRVPVRVHIDEVPEGVNLVAGMTATVQIEPYKAPPPPAPAPASGPVTNAEPKPAPSQVSAQSGPQLASGP
ncbi:MAG TPA: HlyD family secretion protein, partial [Roseiarcus sp.]